MESGFIICWVIKTSALVSFNPEAANIVHDTSAAKNPCFENDFVLVLMV